MADGKSSMLTLPALVTISVCRQEEIATFGFYDEYDIEMWEDDIRGNRHDQTS